MKIENSQFEGRLTLKLGETARLLGISEVSVRRLITRGKLKALKDLRHILVPKSEIEKFVKGVK